MARFESTACRLELGAATNATRVGNNGVFSNLIAGRIRSTEMTKIARVLRKQTGTAIHFDSPLAKGGLGNHFNPLTHHAGAYGILSEQGGYVLNKEFLSDQGLHSITARRLIKNPLLPTTPADDTGLFRLSIDWAQW